MLLPNLFSDCIRFQLVHWLMELYFFWVGARAFNLSVDWFKQIRLSSLLLDFKKKAIETSLAVIDGNSWFIYKKLVVFALGVTNKVETALTALNEVPLNKVPIRLDGILRSGLINRPSLNFSWFTAHDWMFIITGSVYGIQSLVSAMY